tara:strand:+ start:291 stop:401 length:111 start_codon:yes stop_codon:yes gene_type:complete
MNEKNDIFSIKNKVIIITGASKKYLEALFLLILVRI